MQIHPGLVRLERSRGHSFPANVQTLYSGTHHELIFALLTFLSYFCNKVAKWPRVGKKKAPSGRYHASDFSLKNAKLRVNIIVIDTLRVACVCTAFTYPKPSENEVQSFFYARESFLPYNFSHRALCKKWRSDGVMNFRKDDADRFLYVFFMVSSGCLLAIKGHGCISMVTVLTW
jgi:hypothetical protein